MRLYLIKVFYPDEDYSIRTFPTWREYWEEWHEYMSMYCYDKDIRVKGYTISSRKYRKA